ncbi:putative ribonuclease H-like domain-containing protein [Tanacetum coccineum]|uniref:Ribonuclease H-like domain-containing protein n=1 Tax=Tanacetum coccineum TaxID=301880 RepID=A0ABQ5G3F7_9ASTR
MKKYVYLYPLLNDFKLADESQALLKVPRKNNMYSVDMKNIIPKESLTCLVAKATLDESMLWHRRLGHVKFKTINKLVKDNLVKGLPIKRFENDQTCVACLKGKQHKASSSKDETSDILKSFITQIKNLVDKKVKIIRCDNGTEFKNRVMSEFYEKKGIKREFSVARTSQQKGVAERRNRTLIEAARTMLADSKLPTTFWDEAVNTACYVQNRVLVVKPHNNSAVVNAVRANQVNAVKASACWDASNDEPQPSNDAGKKDDEGGINDQERTENSTQDVSTTGPSINTASTNFNTGSLNINTVSPTVPTAPFESAYADFFSDESELDLSNIATTYPVPTTLNIRIHKDHSLDHVQSGVQTRRMINEQGFHVQVKMDNPNITMEENIRLEEEKALFNDTLTSEAALSCEPMISSLNDEIDFRISFDESDDEDCTVIFEKNSFSYKIISINDLKTDSENDNDKVNMPLLPSPEPTVSYFDDLDFFKDFENEFLAIVYNDAKDFENEFPAIVYNDAQTSKLDFLTEPILNPQHIDEFNLKDETSLSEYDEEKQNVICFNDLFSFNVIYPDELKTETDNDNDKVDIEHSSGDLSVKPLPDLINIDVRAYVHVSNKLLETSHDTSNKIFKTETFIKGLNFNIMTWNHLNKGMSFIFLIKNLYVPFGIPFDPKLFYKDGIKLGYQYGVSWGMDTAYRLPV